jgi:hypothetical protein
MRSLCSKPAQHGACNTTLHDTDTTVLPPASRNPRPGCRIIGDGQQTAGSGGEEMLVRGCWETGMCWDVLGGCRLGWDAVRIGGELKSSQC